MIVEMIENTNETEFLEDINDNIEIGDDIKFSTTTLKDGTILYTALIIKG